MPELYYRCTKARCIRELGREAHRRILLCVLECEDEHGTALPAAQAVVVARKDHADIEKYADNLADIDSGEFDFLQNLCDASPRYRISNPEELAAMLAAAN